MLSLIRVALVALFATSVLALSHPTPTKRMTNAQRMARGLPPNPPSRRSRHLKARQSAVPVLGGVNPFSAWCTPRDGVIEAFNVVDNSVIGYISSTLSDKGTYGIVQDITQALQVHANCDGEFFDLSLIGSASEFGFLGGFTGFNSLGNDFVTGSYNHAICSGVEHVDVGSVATTLVDSAITSALNIVVSGESGLWSLSDADSVLTAHWVNDDSSRADTVITYIEEVDMIYFTGDVDAFRSAVTPQNVLEAKLVLQPIPAQ